MSSVEEHAEWTIGFLRKFGQTMIDLDIDSREELEVLLNMLEKEYIDVGGHFLKHCKESKEKESEKDKITICKDDFF